MTRPREYKAGNLSNVPLMLDRELMDKFANILPRHKSISQAVREYMQEVVDEQKNLEALTRLPILAEGSVARQTTITEYDIKLFQPYPERISNMRNLSKEQQTKLQIDLNHMQQEIKLVRKY